MVSRITTAAQDPHILLNMREIQQEKLDAAVRIADLCHRLDIERKNYARLVTLIDGIDMRGEAPPPITRSSGETENATTAHNQGAEPSTRCGLQPFDTFRVPQAIGRHRAVPFTPRSLRHQSETRTEQQTEDGVS